MFSPHVLITLTLMTAIVPETLKAAVPAKTTDATIVDAAVPSCVNHYKAAHIIEMNLTLCECFFHINF